MGLRHTPTVAGAVMTHVTGMPEPPGKPAEPQQSESCAQRSPTDVASARGLADEDTGRPPRRARAAAARASARGQPAALSTTPPSGAAPPQSCPSTTPQLAGPPAGFAPHVPRVAPAAIVHVRVQQSAALAQLSPPCPQNDEAWHVPFEQRLEQQSPPFVHWLPSVLQVVLRGAQVPPVQLWLQQLPFDVQEPWSEVQAG